MPTTNHTITFNPNPGVFPAGETGIRTGISGTLITNMPQSPSRAGYSFNGWRLPNNTTQTGQFVINNAMTLTAIWTPVALNSPTPSPTNTPSAGTNTDTRPNPQTSPVNISFVIFGAVIMVGLASFGIIALAKKQAIATNEYQKKSIRHDREKHIIDIVNK